MAYFCQGQSDEICLVVALPITIYRTELLASLQQDATTDYTWLNVVRNLVATRAFRLL